MIWVQIRSKAANRVLAGLGVVYAVAAVVLAAWLIKDTWGAAGLLDRLLEVVLVGVALVGIWFVANALHNLGVTMPRRSHARKPVNA